MLFCVAANLLTSTCQSSLILAGDKNEQTFEWVGKICLHVALALQARKDLEPFQDEAKIKNLTEEDFISLLPVILHTTQDDALETAAFSDKVSVVAISYNANVSVICELIKKLVTNDKNVSFAVYFSIHMTMDG